MTEVHGNRTTAEYAGKTAVAGQSGAESGALLVESDSIGPDLQMIIERWPELAAAVKADILAKVDD